uniref:Bowman-Birk serine protease inhibitors family domain-containing protein n=1 Tax=Leersia perrieri TaxID=77586 RepID=A0A0D9UWC0_9ORYZ
MKNLATLSFLGALLFAGISAIAAADDNIVLPTDIVVEVDDNEANTVWPWGKCCNDIEKSPLRSLPPRYRCNDRHRLCPPTCSHCEERPIVFPNQPRFVCTDWFIGFNPGPKCSSSSINGGGEKHCSGDENEQVMTEEESKRPWDCCDMTVCTRSSPPTCRCVDTVAKCGSACVQCEKVSSRPARFRCLDRYHGFPGPKCH